jgi:hypothetical protein
MGILCVAAQHVLQALQRALPPVLAPVAGTSAGSSPCFVVMPADAVLSGAVDQVALMSPHRAPPAVSALLPAFALLSALCFTN